MVVEIVECNDISGWFIFDKICRHNMFLTAEEFFVYWRAGVWNNIDLDAIDGLVDCWMALPFVEEL